MINGFETYTANLNEYEKNTLLPIFIKGLSKKVGHKNAVTNKQMVQGLKNLGHNVNDARVRKLINHIRNHNLIPGLIASSKGYFISHNPEEVESYVQSLAQRANEINRIKNGMMRYLYGLKGT